MYRYKKTRKPTQQDRYVTAPDQTNDSLLLKTVLEANSSLELNDVITSAARSIADAVGLPYCGIYLVDEESGEPKIRGGAGRYADRERLMKTAASSESWQEDPLVQAVLVTKEPIAIPNSSESNLINDYVRNKFGFKSILAIPLRARDKVLGFAVVSSFDVAVEFNSSRVEVANGIAKAVALAIDNAQLFLKAQTVAMLEERNRLAQEIHDGLAQKLAGLIMQLDAAELIAANKPDEAAKRRLAAIDMARECLEEARRSVWSLRPKSLEEKALPEAIRAEINGIAAIMDIDISFSITGTARALPMQTEDVLLRITQELLGNIRRHSAARHAQVSLDFEAENIRLLVIDDGKGFDLKKALKEGAGHGLPGLFSRCKALDGTCEITSNKGAGTTICIDIPLKP